MTKKFKVKSKPKIVIKYIMGHSEENFNYIYGKELEDYINNRYIEYANNQFKYYVLKD